MTPNCQVASQKTETVIASEKPSIVTAMELWIMDADGTNQQLLNDFGDANLVETPVWSPEGNFLGIIYGNEDKTEVGLYAMSTNTYVKISKADGKYTGLSWSPDSKALIFLEDRDNNIERYIYLFVFDGNNFFSVNAETMMKNVVWSPVIDIP